MLLTNHLNAGSSWMWFTIAYLAKFIAMESFNWLSWTHQEFPFSIGMTVSILMLCALRVSSLILLLCILQKWEWLMYP